MPKLNKSEIIENPVDVALKAISIGFLAFPTDPRNKKPLILDWPNNATKEPEKIRQYWKQFPHAMTGVVTGHASGVFVLDVDVSDGENAFEKLRDFSDLNGSFPSTMTVKTPSGGLHLYFKMPLGEDLRNSASKIGSGIDIRANGGYVIYPGSVRADGKSYQIISVKEQENE